MSRLVALLMTAVVLAGFAVAWVAAVIGSHAGFDGVDAGFSVTIGLAIASMVVAIVARLSVARARPLTSIQMYGPVLV